MECNEANSGKNSGKIIQAIKDNEDKFTILREYAKRMCEVHDEGQKKARKIMKIHRVVFKNFVSKRILTGIFVKDKNFYEREIVFNHNGIVFKWRENSKADVFWQADNQAMRFFKEVKKAEAEILPLIEKNEKKDLLSKFLKKMGEYILESNFVFPVKSKIKDFITEREWEEIDKYKKVERLVSREDLSPERVCYSSSSKDMGESCDLLNPSLYDFVVIEQLFEELVAFCKAYIQREKERNEKTDTIIEQLQEDLGDYLLLSNLNKDEEEGGWE